MEALYELAWIVPLIPCICFVLAGLIGHKTPQCGGLIAIIGAAASCVMAVLVSYTYWTSDLYTDGQAFVLNMDWLIVGSFTVKFGIYIDSLACIMMLFASFISTLIFVYSLGYMHDQEGKRRRYFAEVSLFLTGMLGLAVSSNFLEMFVFWEVMGLCSYLLIGFWSYDHEEAVEKSSAAKKAFLVTRLGDVCLMCGLFLLLYIFGSLDYQSIFSSIDIYKDEPLLPVAILLMFGGVIGKSAQFPLHDWLPDAMAGPTTVSALIHAATMVKAGIYLVARAYPIFTINEDAMLFVAAIGGFTAIYAASMALNNMNIKRVLAYSTLSQLGYMVLALGAGAYLIAVGTRTGDHHLIELGTAGYIAGILHMINHAFFKALLFLGSGSVIHAVGTEDMRAMGGLRKAMPITSFTMLIGCLSIAGIPIFSGFWSKDLVLEAAFAPFEHELGFGSAFCVLFIMGIITAFMTAFYMFRMWFMTFCGQPRGHCHGESPKSMTFPLIVLSFFAIASGLVIFGEFGEFIARSLQTSMPAIKAYAVAESGMDVVEAIFKNKWTYVALVLAVVGILIAFFMYVKRPYEAEKFDQDKKSALYRFVAKRYYFPQLYNQISWKLGYGVARGVEAVDRQLIDGTVNGLSNAVVGGGDGLAKLETGYVRDYAAYVALGVLILMGIFAAVFLYGGGF